MENEKTNAAPRRTLKIGSLRLAAMALVLGIAILINLIAAALPETLTKPDTTASGLYTLSQETEEVLQRVDTDVTLYLLAERGGEDATIRTLLERYAALNSHIQVQVIDPGTHPTFIQSYTTDTLYANSVIAESGARYKVVPYTDIYTTEYSEEDYYNYMYYGIQPTGTTYFSGEQAISSALDYVTKDDIPTLYALEGHGEGTLSAKYQSYLKNDNVLYSTLSLLTADSVPSDCAALLIQNPTADISTDDLAKLSAYLERGGRILLVTGYPAYSEAAMPNLAALCAMVGLESVDGLILESDRNHYTGYPYSLLPTRGTTGPMALASGNTTYVLMHAAHGILRSGEDTGTLYPLLTTSSGAYVKQVENGALSTFEKEEGDIAGTMYVGAAVSLPADDGQEGRFAWFSAASLVDDDADQAVSGGNSDTFMAAVNWMTDGGASLSILSKQLDPTMLTVPAAQAGFWSVIVIFILPLAVLSGGFIVWLRRRKR